MGGGGIWMQQEGPSENLFGGEILAMLVICPRKGAGLKMGQNGK